MLSDTPDDPLAVLRDPQHKYDAIEAFERYLERLPEPVAQFSDDGKPRLSRIELGDFTKAAVDPISYALERLWPRGFVTLLAAHGGAGKSTLALAILMHVAAGAPFAGLACTAGRTAFVSLEDPPDLVRFRMRRIAAAYELDSAAIQHNFVLIDGTTGDGALVTEVSEFGTRKVIPTLAMEQLRGMVHGCIAIAIDNASDAFDADEVRRKSVRSFIRLLATVARENHAAVVLLAHIDKASAKFGSNGNSYSGSTAWHNSSRSRLALIEADGAVQLIQEKNNLGPKLPEPLLFAWSEAGVLVPALRSAASFRPSEVDEGADEAAVLAAVRSANAAGVTVPTARSGPATTLQALMTLPELPKVLRLKPQRERFWNALTRLQRSGAIKVEEYRTPQRNQRERWVAA